MKVTFEFSGFYKRLSDYFNLDRKLCLLLPIIIMKLGMKRWSMDSLYLGNIDLADNFSLIILLNLLMTKWINLKWIGSLRTEEPEWNLRNGYFTDRQYYKISIVPEYKHSLNQNEVITYKAGVAWDDTNRDKQRFSPIAEISWTRTENEKNSENIYLSYSESTQVLGYGAIGGPTNSGTFRSTRDLRRSVSKNLEFGYKINKDKWKLNTSIFHRRDNDLVDWTYDSNWTKYRKANHVDIKTFGVEIIASRQWDNFEAICSYAYLEKSEDYADPSVLEVSMH